MIALPCEAVVLSVGNDVTCTHASLQLAIDAASGAGPHQIKLKTDTYTAQAINLAGKDITLTGGFATCGAPTPTGVSTLSGLGGVAASVIGITGAGNDVILENLSIIRGDEVVAGSGGGIDFRGNGFLTLRQTVVAQNYAGYGGGIYVSTNDTAELRIEAGSVIQNNTAQFSGGGIRLAGQVRMTMIDDRTIIQGNQALGVNPSNGQAQDGHGGGLLLIAPATADIGSPGFGSDGVLTGNSARFGGAVSLRGGPANGSIAYLRLYSIDPERASRISGNHALQNGGGIYLEPDASTGSDTSVCAVDLRIDGNRAPQGSAIYSNTSANLGDFPIGGLVQLVSGQDAEPCGLAARLPQCDPGAVCGSIDGNLSEDANGQPMEGATVLLRGKSFFSADRVTFRRNEGAQLIRILDAGADAFLDNCLIADNLASAQLIWQEAGTGSELDVEGCTLANNQIGASHVMSIANGLRIGRSILDQPGKTSVQLNSGTVQANSVIARETLSLGGGPTLMLAAPRFIDPAHGDYRLQAASPAVEYAALIGSPVRDLDGTLRGRELDLVSNRFGPADLGAYERAEIGNLVLNDDFYLDLRLWDVLRTGVATREGLGFNTMGALRLSYTRSSADMPPAGNLIGVNQCMRIPGPGSYVLNGRAYGVGGDGFSRDRVSLQWSFIANTGGESCAGAVTRTGSVNFPTTASWSAPVAPALIEISSAEFTSNSAVVIAPMVTEGGLALLATTTGFFDQISLRPVVAPDGPLFADGFE
jgi:hypothetical protein